MAEFLHQPVLYEETLEALHIRPDGVYVDGTMGGAGHARGIAGRLTTGLLVAIDQDASAIAAGRERLAPFAERVVVVQDNFSNMAAVLQRLKIEKVDGILLDLGVSSFQLDCAARGFSYHADAPLDMRMDQRGGQSAYDVVNGESQQSLTRILREYGEERYAAAIARRICAARVDKPIQTTQELVELIKSAIPAAARREGGHPAKRSFQAIRIAVNDELGALRRALDGMLSLLRPGGRIAIITFHSLEDRMVKQAFADWSRGCVCPKDFPVCVCHNKPKIVLISKKGISPSKEELQQNPRSASARLRVGERCEEE